MLSSVGKGDVREAKQMNSYQRTVKGQETTGTTCNKGNRKNRKKFSLCPKGGLW